MLPLGIAPDGDGRYPDVRVIDERGIETPYAIDPPRAATNVRDVALVGSGFDPRHGSRAIADLGRRAAPVDDVVLSVDVEQHPTYFERVAVDASDDRRHWRTVRENAIVYRVADDDGKGDQRVTFAPTRSRWLRIRILDPHAPFILTSAGVARVRAEREPLLPLPLAPVASSDAAAHRQIWTFDAAVPLRPSCVSFGAAAGTFVRPVRIEARSDGTNWSFAGDGTIARYADGTVQTAFCFPEDTAAAWRVVVENGDDAPLAARPVLLGVPHELVFKISPGHTYRLLSGNPAALPANYDLGDRLAHARWVAVPATVGANGPNPAHRVFGRPWSRLAWFLAALLGTAAVAGIALFGARRTRANASSRST